MHATIRFAEGDLTPPPGAGAPVLLHPWEWNNTIHASVVLGRLTIHADAYELAAWLDSTAVDLQHLLNEHAAKALDEQTDSDLAATLAVLAAAGDPDPQMTVDFVGVDQALADVAR